MKKILSFILLIICLNAVSQNKEYARSIIDTLSHQVKSGRGVANDGANKAAEFIKNEFQKNGASSFGNFFQYFTHDITHISNFKAENGKLRAGYDIVASIRSSSVNDRFNLAFITEEMLVDTAKLSEFLRKNAHKKLIVIPHQLLNSNNENRRLLTNLANSNYKNAKGFVFTSAKTPIWDANLSRGFLDYPLLTVNDSALNSLKSKKLKIELEVKKLSQYNLKNVIGYIPGTEFPDSFVVFTAHYDHLGMLGTDVYYPGANDNASGVAYLLDLAAHYVLNPAKYSVVFIACAAEEMGLLGSLYFTENPLFPLENIKFLINLDMVGNGADGIHIVNGTEFPEHFDRFVEINKQHNLVKNIGKGGKSCNSDHCHFFKKSVPAIFIFTRDENHRYYHVPQDKADIIPLTAYNQLFELLQLFVKSL